MVGNVAIEAWIGAGHRASARDANILLRTPILRTACRDRKVIATPTLLALLFSSLSCRWLTMSALCSLSPPYRTLAIFG